MSDLWILAGQSNMEGCGKLRNAEPPMESVRSFAHGDYWKVAEEPLHWLIDAVDDVHHEGIFGEDLESARVQQHRDRTAGTGVGLPFAKTIAERTGLSIDLLPTAHGGTSMSQWSPDLKSLGGASLYGTMLRRVKLALETGGDTRLRGILWYQGESDADPTASVLYQERMVRFINEVRQDLNAPNLPFIFVQLGIFANDIPTDNESTVAWELVREVQRKLPGIVPHTAVAAAIDLEIDDGIHIGTRGLKRLGKRLASLALNDVYGIASPTTPVLKSITKDTIPGESPVIRVSFENVTGKLIAPDPSGRVPGFSISTNSGAHSTVPIHKSSLDSERPGDVLLFTELPITKNTRIYYGGGMFPFCQLTDSADMAVPAFGPVPVN